MRVRAYAKINCGLRILAKRPDGYHEIHTIYQTVALHDRLDVRLVRSGRNIKVECDDPAVPAGRANLVYRACELWRQVRKYQGGMRVCIEKRIPLGSGLGGASGDAAATLLALERLSGDRLDLTARLAVAARLGSDVPLFMLGGRVLGCGRGEQVYPLQDLPARYCLIAFPGFPVSTAEAYREAGRRLTKGPGGRSIDFFGAWPHLPLLSWGPAENDFEQVLFAWWPELARLKRRLVRAGAELASLTGSGSAVYGLFPSARTLDHAWKLIPAGWLKFRTRTISRVGYRRGLLAG
jgi:4-diphosphocytidyl-2-C-methyl-D-erythritol kinase